MSEQETVIDIVDVERTFNVRERSVEALRGVDMRIERGSMVVLMGPSGSGKTTLLNIVGGLDQPTGGAVTVEAAGWTASAAPSWWGYAGASALSSRASR